MEKEQRRKRQQQVAERAAWNVPEWCAALQLGRSTYYTLSHRPRYIKVGKRLLIVEAPADYAARIAKLQGATRAA